jgi:hypothetical protein
MRRPYFRGQIDATDRRIDRLMYELAEVEVRIVEANQ